MINDATITIARNFDEYRIEDLKIPSLIFQVKDD